MLRKILLALLLLLVVLLVVGAVMPNRYEVERRIAIAAAPERVHAFVGELKRWDEWTPWKEVDPSTQTTLGEKSTGVGASQSWTGDQGGGWLRFTECDPTTGIAFDMGFVNGEHESPAKAEIRYRASGGQTEVVWSMSGTMDMPVIGSWVALAVGPMIGTSFDKGLAKLKQVAEAK